MISCIRRVAQKQPTGSALSRDDSNYVQDYINTTDLLFVIPLRSTEDSRRLACFSHISFFDLKFQSIFFLGF